MTHAEIFKYLEKILSSRGIKYELTTNEKGKPVIKLGLKYYPSVSGELFIDRGYLVSEIIYADYDVNYDYKNRIADLDEIDTENAIDDHIFKIEQAFQCIEEGGFDDDDVDIEDFDEAYRILTRAGYTLLKE